MKTHRLIPALLLLAVSGSFAQPAPIPRPQPPKPGAHKPGTNTGGSATDFDLPAEFRSVDGSANNTANSTWGTPGTPFVRLAPSEYADGTGSPAGATRPSPRAISNAVIAQPFLRPNARGASDMIWQWGQFIDHDLDETMTATPEEAFPILVPTGDPSFDPTSTGTVTTSAARADVRTTLALWPRSVHVGPWYGRVFDNGRRALDEVVHFISQTLQNEVTP